MAKPTVYIETSVISYFVGRPSKNLLTTTRQQITRRWWIEYLPVCDPCISIAVENEIRDGDATMAAKRLVAASSFPLLPLGDTIDRVIEALLKRRLVPAKSPTDAAHLAFAAVHGVDFLATWNFRHLANPFILPQVRRLCQEFGCRLPEVCSPEQLLASR